MSADAVRVPTWPAVLLGLQVVCSELQPNVTPSPTAVRYAMFAIGALVPLTFVALRSLSLVDTLRAAPTRWLALFAAWSCVAAIWSIDPTHAIQPAIWFVAMVSYVSWFVSQFGWRVTRLVIAVAIDLFVIASMVFYVVDGQSGRLQGLAFGPTNLGYLGGVAAILGISLTGGRGWARLAARASAAIGIAAVVLSSTRTVAIGLVAVGAYTMFRRRGRAGSLLVAIALLLAIGVGVAGASGGLIVTSRTPDGTDFVEQRNGLITLNHSPDSSEFVTATGRTTVWRESVRLIGERPLFGWGTGSGERLFDEVAAEGRLSWLARGAHNTLLGITLAQGAIGVLLFLAAVASYLGVARRVPDHARSALMLLMLIDSIGESLFDTGRIALIIAAAVFAAAANDARVLDRRVRAAANPEPLLV